MKTINVVTAFALLGVVGIGSAWADRGFHGGHGGGHIGIYLGVPFGPWYYPPPYYYPPAYYAPVVVQQQPQVYVEQPQVAVVPAAPVATPPSNYWYYCATAKGYYPYVKECPGGWQKVSPQPPGQP